MKKKVPAILLFIIICAVAALAIAFLRPYKPTSFVVDGDIFSATVEDGATLILDLDNDSNGKEWSIIQTPEHSQCFIKDFVTVTENITEFHIIAADDGKGVMTFQSVSDDGTTENYELELTISRHKKSCLQIDTVSFVRTESGIETKSDMAEDKTDTEQVSAVVPSVMIHGVLYQDTGYTDDDVLPGHRNQCDPKPGNYYTAIEPVGIRMLIRTSAAVDISKSHRYHDGPDDYGPHDLRRTEIRSQQSAGSEFNCHYTHTCEKFSQIQVCLIL